MYTSIIDSSIMDSSIIDSSIIDSSIIDSSIIDSSIIETTTETEEYNEITNNDMEEVIEAFNETKEATETEDLIDTVIAIVSESIAEEISDKITEEVTATEEIIDIAIKITSETIESIVLEISDEILKGANEDNNNEDQKGEVKTS